MTNQNPEGPPAVGAPLQTSTLAPSGGGATRADAGLPVSSPPAQTDSGAARDAGTEVAPPAAPSCTGLTLGGSCYELFNSFSVWNAAEQQCVAWGGHLASIESAADDAALSAWWPAQLGLANADGSGIWLGGTDAQSDGTFQWVDGSSLGYVGWQPGQPDDGAGVDCIEKRNDGAGGRWYDRRCTDALRYLCKRPL